MSAPVLVTGATGFLGHTLCPYLVERGYQLRAFVRPSSSWGFLRPLGVEWAWGDVREATAVRAATAGCRASLLRDRPAGDSFAVVLTEEVFAVEIQRRLRADF